MASEHVRPGPALVDTSLAALDAAGTATVVNPLGDVKAGAIQVVAMLDEAHVGTWEFDLRVQRVTDAATGVSGPQRDVSNAEFAFVSDDDAVVYPRRASSTAAALLATAREEARQQRAILSESLERYQDQFICALADDARAYDAYRKLQAITRNEGAVAYQFLQARNVLESEHSTEKQRAEATAKEQGAVSSELFLRRDVRQLQRRLQTAVRRYRKGCLLLLVPEPQRQLITPLSMDP
jgi:hypothetical protein